MYVMNERNSDKSKSRIFIFSFVDDEQVQVVFGSKAVHKQTFIQKSYSSCLLGVLHFPMHREKDRDNISPFLDVEQTSSRHHMALPKVPPEHHCPERP